MQLSKIIIILAFTSLIYGCKQKQIIFNLNFENSPEGNYSIASLNKDVNTANGIILKNRAEIIKEDNNSVLKVKYPKGSIGPEYSGIKFEKALPKSNNYILEYDLKFNDNFDFAFGGKLPGLTSGGSTYTGGKHPDNGEGWSTRYMWIENGEIVIYFYHMDMKHKWGDAIKMNVFFNTGKWYHIKQHIKLNDMDKFNGSLEVWVDKNKVISKTNIRYRVEPLGAIDTFYFSTFHGGNTSEWAPKIDSYISFDNFKVTSPKTN